MSRDSEERLRQTLQKLEEVSNELYFVTVDSSWDRCLLEDSRRFVRYAKDALGDICARTLLEDTEED